MVDAFVNSQKGTIYLVMQLVNGLTIRKYVKRQQKKRIESELQYQKLGLLSKQSLTSIDSNKSCQILAGGLPED